MYARGQFWDEEMSHTRQQATTKHSSILPSLPRRRQSLVPHALESAKKLPVVFYRECRDETFKSHHNYGPEKSKGNLMLLLHLSSEHIQSLHSTQLSQGRSGGFWSKSWPILPKISAVSCHTSRKDLFGCVLKHYFYWNSNKSKAEGALLHPQ